MALQPERIESTDFPVSRKGFDKDQVRLFLRQVAGEIRTMQADSAAAIEEARAEASAAAEAQAPTPAAQGDQFGALGDRIAVLLREAHDASELTREQAEEEAEALRVEAEEHLEAARAEAQQIRDDAAAYRTEVDLEAIAIRDQAEVDGNARLDERRTVIEEQEAAVKAERETALQELSDARSQVAVLLQEARAQSEFIKREAEEIIRTKVRANMEQAQRRIDVLRTTEASSKDRILTAQRELESALTRLESEPLPEFPTDTEDLVLSEAEERAISAGAGSGGESNSGFGSTPSLGEDVVSLGGDVVDVDAVVAQPADSAEEEAQEIVDVAEARAEGGSGDETPDVDDAFPTEEPTVTESVVGPGVEAQETVEQPSAADEVSENEGPVPPMPPTAGDVIVEDSASPTDTESASAGGMFDIDPVVGSEPDSPDNGYETAADHSSFDLPTTPVRTPPEHAVVGGSFNETAFTDAPGTDADTPENEDALARLVREAMQRAVESARGSEV